MLGVCGTKLLKETVAVLGVCGVVVAGDAAYVLAHAWRLKVVWRCGTVAVQCGRESVYKGKCNDIYDPGFLKKACY